MESEKLSFLFRVLLVLAVATSAAAQKSVIVENLTLEEAKDIYAKIFEVGKVAEVAKIMAEVETKKAVQEIMEDLQKADLCRAHESILGLHPEGGEGQEETIVDSMHEINEKLDKELEKIFRLLDEEWSMLQAEVETEAVHKIMEDLQKADRRRAHESILRLHPEGGEGQEETIADSEHEIMEKMDEELQKIYRWMDEELAEFEEFDGDIVAAVETIMAEMETAKEGMEEAVHEIMEDLQKADRRRPQRPFLELYLPGGEGQEETITASVHKIIEMLDVDIQKICRSMEEEWLRDLAEQFE